MCTVLMTTYIRCSRVQCKRVRAAIDWLILNNPLYKDCRYDPERMAVYEKLPNGILQQPSASQTCDILIISHQSMIQ